MHIGVLGTGGWARVHLEALAASPHVSKVTLVGRNDQARTELARKYPIVSATLQDHRQLLADPSIELVHVVLPHHLHASRVTDALAAGKHVICEKPAAINLAEFDAMVTTAANYQLRFLVVMNHLYNPVVWRVRELLDQGTIGRPFLSTENSYSSASKFYRDASNWRNSIDGAGGGILIDGGYHMVYRHLFMLAGHGSPQWAIAHAAQLGVSEDGSLVQTKGEDFVSITIGYATSLRISWGHAWTLAANIERSRQSFIAGTQGTLEFTDNPQSPILLHSPQRQTAVDVDSGPQSGTETAHDCLLDYLDCVATDREPERATTDFARTTLATILAAYESGRSERRIPVS